MVCSILLCETFIPYARADRLPRFPLYMNVMTANLLEAPLLYVSALPWAHEAQAFGHKTVDGWKPSGPALQEVPVPVVGGKKR